MVFLTNDILSIDDIKNVVIPIEKPSCVIKFQIKCTC